jgi:hypothetical protein
MNAPLLETNVQNYGFNDLRKIAKAIFLPMWGALRGVKPPAEGVAEKP